MRDKDSQLIFENYLNSKKNVVLEADEKKWEDESSAWAWFKTFDPTGLSSWPDVYDSAVEVRDNKGKDIWPWLKLIFNIFLALPNFGILAFGVGSAGWAGLRAASKAALKAGAKGGGMDVAQKIVKMIGESDIMRGAFSKIIKQLRKENILTKGQIETIINQIRSKGVSAAGREEMVAKAVKSSIKDAVSPTFKKAQLTKTAGRAGVQLYGAGENFLKGGVDSEDDVFSDKSQDNKPTSSPSGKRPSSKRVIKGQEKEQPKKTEQPKTEQPSAPKYAFDDI